MINMCYCYREDEERVEKYQGMFDIFVSYQPGSTILLNTGHIQVGPDYHPDSVILLNTGHIEE